jgi:hypothetical protein
MAALILSSMKPRLIQAWRSEGPPLVKLFGGAACTWLISEMDPDQPDLMFGLCDLGFGTPELGYVRLSELEAIRFPPFGLGVERDRYWSAVKGKTMAQYAAEARVKGRIAA